MSISGRPDPFVRLLRNPEFRWRLRIAAAVIPLALTVALSMLRATISEDLRRGGSDFLYYYLGPERFTVIVGFLILASLASLLMLYLQTGFRRHAQSELAAVEGRRTDSQVVDVLEDQVRRLETEIDDLRKERPTESATTIITPQERVEVLEELKRKLENDAASDLMRRFRDQARVSVIQEQITATLSRLAREVDALSRRGNLNLVIGSTTTVGGIAALFYFLLFKQASVDPKVNPLGYLAEFAPRLSVVVLIEIFAYFFLTLYRNSLSEIKYFQNEMTNLECRAVASVAAVQHADAATVAAVILKFAETERNYLKKGRKHGGG